MNKSVLITGVSRGLGKELLEVFLQKEMRVIGIVRSKDNYDSLNSSHLNATFIHADIEENDLAFKLRKVLRNDPLDLIINNAGMSGGTNLSFKTVSTKEIVQLFNVHCLGPINVTQSCLDNLLMSSSPVILNISSRFGSLNLLAKNEINSINASYAYRIAKAAQNMFTLILQQEYKDKIKVVSIHPGRLKTHNAPNDAVWLPKEGAQRLYEFWNKGLFGFSEGIYDLENNLYLPW